MTTGINEKQYELLWAEYAYRHTHIWSTIYKITAAVAAVCVVPYIKPDVTSPLGFLALSLPVIGVAIAVLGSARIHHELKLFDKIKLRYRDAQEDLFKIPHKSTGRFARDVMIYMRALVSLAILNTLYLVISLLLQ